VLGPDAPPLTSAPLTSLEVETASIRRPCLPSNLGPVGIYPMSYAP